MQGVLALLAWVADADNLNLIGALLVKLNLIYDGIESVIVGA